MISRRHFLISLGGAALGINALGGHEPLPYYLQSRTADRIFKIGYLKEGSDLEPARRLLKRLVIEINASNTLQQLMKQAGIDLIALRPCDGPRDMLQRLDNEEFDLTFATSVIYATHLNETTGEGSGIEPIIEAITQPKYEAILQFKRRGDTGDERSGYSRPAVIFVGPGSELWNVQYPSQRQIARALARKPLAVSHSFSAASYIYLRAKMADQYSPVTPDFQFNETSEEVIKHVMSGLLDMGAVEKQLLEDMAVGIHDGEIVEYYRIIVHTDKIPTDPILIHRDFNPIRSKLGSELKVALRTFFDSAELKVANSSQRAYEDIREVIAKDRTLNFADPSKPARSTVLPPTIDKNSAGDRSSL